MTLKLNGSSSGSVSIDAPASTTAGADITFNFPVADGSANQVLQTNGSGQLQWVTLPTASSALSEYDQWRLTSDTVNTLNPLVNWARTTSSGFAKIGTGMSHSSGEFTFPSTGIWEVIARPHFKQTNGGDSDHMYFATYYTPDDGSNWTATTYAIGSNVDNNGQCTAISFFTTDITDTSNQKMKFSFDPDHSNGQIQGNTSILETNLIFKKLAET